MRVLITRPWQQSRQSAALLHGLGHRPIIEPLTRIEALKWDVSELDEVDHVVLTSPNGAREFVDRTRGRPRPTAYAVGEATAAPLIAARCMVAGIAQGTAEGLLSLITRTCPRGKRLLHLSGDMIAVNLAAALSAEGYRASQQITYRVVPVEGAAGRIASRVGGERLDCCLFFSVRGAKLFVDALAMHGTSQACRSLGAVAFSERIARPLSGLPWRVLRSIERPTHGELLKTLNELEIGRQSTDLTDHGAGWLQNHLRN